MAIKPSGALIGAAATAIGLVVASWQLSGTIADSIRAPLVAEIRRHDDADAVVLRRLEAEDARMWEKVNAHDGRVYKLEKAVDLLDTWKTERASDIAHLREVFGLQIDLKCRLAKTK